MFKAASPESIRIIPQSHFSQLASSAYSQFPHRSRFYCAGTRGNKGWPVLHEGLLLPSISIFTPCFEQLAHSSAALD